MLGSSKKLTSAKRKEGLADRENNRYEDLDRSSVYRGCMSRGTGRQPGLVVRV